MRPARFLGIVGLVVAALLGGGVAVDPSSAGAQAPAAVAQAPVTTVIPLADGRSYNLHYEPDNQTPLPLVVALHAANHTAGVFERMSGLTPYADSHGFVLIYGNGIGGRWNSGTCCGAYDYDDVDYLRRAVADAATRTPIDPTRVYVIGFSNGAMQAWRTVCEAPGVFAAAGVISGALLVPCDQTTVHVYHQHGLQDRTVPLAGGVGFEGATFPDSRTEQARVGPYSDIQQNWLDGGHSWPATTDDAIWAYLQTVHM